MQGYVMESKGNESTGASGDGSNAGRAHYSECQRAIAARRAISRRRFALSFSARALPPFNPPRRPRAIACGFFRRVMTVRGARPLPRNFANKIGRFRDGAAKAGPNPMLDHVRTARSQRASRIRGM